MSGDLEKALDEIGRITDAGVGSGCLDYPSLEKAVRGYLDVCGIVPFTDPDTIRRTQMVMGRAIIVHAALKSPVYADRIPKELLSKPDCLRRVRSLFSVSKGDLLDKDKWYVETPWKSIDTKTSGSTGPPFGYRIWEDIYDPIERDHHYKMVLDEFGVEEPCVLQIGPRLDASYDVVNVGRLPIFVSDADKMVNRFTRLHCSHGAAAKYYHMVLNDDSFLHINDYFNYMIDFIGKNKVNVLLATGGVFELLTTFLVSDDTTVFPRLASLISNTGDTVSAHTLTFLKETGVTDNWCDHMRCWDGGASFFTCSHGKYHLQDELSYVFSNDEDRLVSVDFFSYPSPFVNYLNGDYCQVSDGYTKCDCGRWHREFKFLDRRSRKYQDVNGEYYDVNAVMKEILQKYPLGFISMQDGSVSIEDSNLTDEQKTGIVKDLSKLYVMVHFFKNPRLVKLDDILCTKDSDCVAPYTCHCFKPGDGQFTCQCSYNGVPF